MTEPVHIISLGAGVQSSTMALMAAHGEITPMPKCAVFADTQAEPPSVYHWLDWLEKQLPFPVHRVSAGSLEKRETEVRRSKKSGKLYRRSGVPMFTNKLDQKYPHSGLMELGILGRKCTRDFKVDPITRFARTLANIKRGQKEVSVIQWIGISADEMQRMKPSRYAFCEHRWPLIEHRISRRACLEWMRAHSYPQPPRSACVFCPYHSNQEWRRLRDEEPDQFARAVAFEKSVQAAARSDEVTDGELFLHASRVPLDEVDLRTDADHGQLSLWQDECEGMCGV